jgi:poly(3-hydroxybutyrate) depolymerase
MSPAGSGRWWLAALCVVALGLPASAAVGDGLVEQARAALGERGARAAEFLGRNMPEADRSALSPSFLLEHLRLALLARDEFPWARTVPEEIFLNDVLPYAVFDEPREAWRGRFLALARDLVAGSATASEAAQALNRGFFTRIGVHYHTGRRAPNQGASESIATGKASCSGLSILMVYACRAVGIPARGVGTPMWADGSGNHTWVEVWDGGWHFTGADEYDSRGLDHAWFTGQAARASSGRSGIFATSWVRTGSGFPLVWAPDATAVAAVDVTERYARARPTAASSLADLGLRLFDRPGGQRLEARIEVLDATGKVLGEAVTRAGRHDLNDMPRMALPPGCSGRLRIHHGGASREMPFGPLAAGDSALDLAWEAVPPAPAEIPPAGADTAVLAELAAWLALPVAERRRDAAVLARPLDRATARRARDLLAADRLRSIAAARQRALESRAIERDGRTLRWLEKTFGEAPAGGRSLWISLHGGGGAPPQVNDQQWRNQITLYRPEEGIHLAPRAPTDTWNLWHEAHIDPLFADLIEAFVAGRGVDPDKVYLLGYSAGGDGVWQVAPRMADRFAAAAMMAGHPNEASLLGLRNLPFAIFMGGEDAAYQRNRIAAERGAELGRLQREDPAGYVHLVKIYPGLGHWMDGKDAEALPWMRAFSRQPWPERVVWHQDDVIHRRLYWLSHPSTPPTAGQTVTATVDGGVVTLAGDVPAGMRLHLDDALLDLDRPLSVRVNGAQVWSGRVVRSAGVLDDELAGRADAPAAACAIIDLP